ncbi:MAG: hypothetical protein M3362_19795, partial [Acidobacteriota bacterium]|nr:hypothetical protein [Acidobacteriota bacterium]
MPDIIDDISETKETKQTEGIAKSPAKSRKKLFIIILVILLAAGGGGFYIYRSRAATAKAKEKNDKVITDADKNAKSENPNSKKLLEISLPDDSEVKQVVELQPFIVNLADESEPRYLRMT